MIKRLLLCSLALLILSSCANKAAENNETEDLNSIKITPVEYATKTPNVVYAKEDSGDMHLSYRFKYEYDFPTEGPQALLDSVRHFFAVEVIKSISRNAQENVAPQVFALDTLFSDPQAYLNAIGKIEEETVKKKVFTGVEQSAWMKKTYEDSTLVTYVFQEYFFEGKGGSYNYIKGLTFLKDNGTPLDWNIFADRDLTQLLKPYLIKYFKEFYMTSFNEYDLYSSCYKDSVNRQRIASPKTMPYITDEGFNFTYKANEIVSELYGVPYFNIPVDSVKKYLTPEAQKFFQKN